MKDCVGEVAARRLGECGEDLAERWLKLQHRLHDVLGVFNYTEPIKGLSWLGW